MKSSAQTMSAFMAGSMIAADGTTDVTARLTYQPRDPYAITVTITDRTGAVQVWTIERDLLLSGLTAQASCPAGRHRVRLWTCQHHNGPSLMIAMMASFVAFLELNLEKVADFAIGTLQLVPQGQEPSQLNLDAELERLTA